MLITPVVSTDLYKGDGPSFVLNDYLLNKYPSLHQSPYYYEDMTADRKGKLSTPTANASEDFDLVYSKKGIIEDRALIPYSIIYDPLQRKPALGSKSGRSIDLIQN